MYITRLGSLTTMPVTPSKVIHCPSCGNETSFSFRFEKKGRRFWRCCECKLEKQHPLPTEQDLKDYYEDSYDVGMYRDFAAANEMKVLTARQRIKELKKSVSLDGKWLDVGCANGVFVKEAIALGIDAEGVELSENAVAEGKDQGIPISAGTIADLDGDVKYDCITAFDVLEHVIDPESFMRDITNRLKPGGHVVLTVPNCSSLPAKLMGSRWYFYIPEEHLHYFDPDKIESFASRMGTEHVSTRRTFKPLTFDYSLLQFKEFNPLIYRTLALLGKLVPAALRRKIIPLYIGEMMLIAKMPTSESVDQVDLETRTRSLDAATANCPSAAMLRPLPRECAQYQTARSSRFRIERVSPTSASPNVIGPTRPMNIRTMTTNLLTGVRSPVRPRESPTVPSADAASKITSWNGLSPCNRSKRKPPMKKIVI
jgi:2-polyprenyl-3-methyl-5-hydroxy-6-metoxy-1,4-benzoquinol methylase